MLHLLAKNWSLILLRGIAAVLFGALALVWPGVTLVTLTMLYGVFAAADGALALAAAVLGGTIVPRWWLALVGLAGLGAALAAFVYPGMTAIVLVMFIGAWAVARGIFQVIGAIQLRKAIENEWLLILDGIVSVLFGGAIMVWPGEGALAMIWVLGAYAIVVGALLIGLSLRLRNHVAPHEPRAAAG